MGSGKAERRHGRFSPKVDGTGDDEPGDAGWARGREGRGWFPPDFFCCSEMVKRKKFPFGWEGWWVWRHARNGAAAEGMPVKSKVRPGKQRLSEVDPGSG